MSNSKKAPQPFTFTSSNSEKMYTPTKNPQSDSMGSGESQTNYSRNASGSKAGATAVAAAVAVTTSGSGLGSSGLAHYITENQELREKLRISESQLNEARDNIVVLSRKLNENESDIHGYQSQMMKQSNISAMKTHQLNRMTTEFENLNLSQKEIIERSRESNIALINDLGEKQKEIGRLKDLSKNRIDQLSVTSVAYNQASSKINRLEEAVDSRDREIASLKRELEEARQTINDLQMVKKSEGLAIVEIEHLQADVKRLVKMLKTTKEFSDFADFADDTTGSIRFLKDSLRQTQTDISHRRIRGAATTDDVVQRLCVQESLLDEKDMWMPHEAFKYAKEFKRQYKGELTDALLEKLLFELNRIWSKRENQRVQRVQSQCTRDVMKLKRKISQTPTFNEVHSTQTINRLKADLKSSYTENRKAFAERSERNPPGTHYVNETMKMIKDAQKTKKVMTLENNFLRDQLKSSCASRSHLGF